MPCGKRTPGYDVAPWTLNASPPNGSSTFALGRTGKKLPAFLNWLGVIGWDVLNNILSTAALVALLSGFNIPIPFWAALALLVAVQLVIGVYGHHLIQDTAKYTGALLAAFFVVIGIIAIHKSGGLPVVAKPASSKEIFMAFALMVGFNGGGWAPYTADYTRYLPKNTPSQKVFFPIFSSLFLSLFTLSFFGYMTASVVTDQTPEGVMKALQDLTGRFSPLVLFLIAFNSIPVNAVNDNSGAYSLMAAGFKFSRPIAAIFGAVFGYFVCLLASSSFVDFFENFLYLFVHWVGPWAAIILVHWFVVGKKEQKTPSGITTGCLIFVGISLISILLFSSNSLYTGLLSDAVGGMDIGPYLGFLSAGALYYVTLRFKAAKARR